MRIDHIAIRSNDRYKTAEFYYHVGYKLVDEFKINFDDGSKADCIVLECSFFDYTLDTFMSHNRNRYYAPPRIFISDGDENSIVGRWVKSRSGPNVHHIAWEICGDMTWFIDIMKNNGVEFMSEPIKCENGLVQVFTKEMSGMVHEFISGKQSFCKESVKQLMEVSDA